MSSMSQSRGISRADALSLEKTAVHTQHFQNNDEIAGAGTLITKTRRKQLVVPSDETVKVPVVRKEKVCTIHQHTVQGKKLVPVTKVKEVPETKLEVQFVTVNGKKEKRYVPVTNLKRVKYTDFEEQVVDVTVDVPMEEIVTRTGVREDKHVTSRVFDVEEDYTYELRPVLVKKSEPRMMDRDDHHTFKTMHGTPVWDELREGWLGRPQTPAYKSHLHRPSSAGALSRPGTSYSRPGTSQSRPGTGLRRPGTGQKFGSNSLIRSLSTADTLVL